MSLAADRDNAVLVPRGDIVPTFRTLLERQELIVGHGVAYDMTCLAAESPELVPAIFNHYEADLIEDTSVRQKLLDNAHGLLRGFYRRGGKAVKIGYSLDDLTRRLFSVELDKTTWRRRYAELADVPIEEWPEGARAYALGDASWTWRVYDAQEDERMSDGADLLADQHRQARSAFWLRLMSAWGLTTDPQAVEAFADGKRAERDALAQRLMDVGLVTRTRQGTWKREAKFAALRLSAAYERSQRKAPRTAGTDRNPEGQVALDDDACRGSGDEDLIAYAEYSSLSKVISTDVPLLELGTVDPIHPHFEELLATGRTSSSPNVQNLPRYGAMRSCFVPRPGYVYAAADYSLLELCTVAQVLVSRFGKSRLADALNAGRDPHLEVAASLMGISYEEADKRKKAGDPEVKKMRDFGKVPNYGVPGGLGPDRLVHFAWTAHKVEITRAQAVATKETFLATWPEFRLYFAWVGAEVERPRARVRQLFSDRWRGRVSYTEACNGYFQGLGSDVAKAAGWDVARACYVGPSVLYGSRPVNFVHDEFILEVPEEIGHECAHELAAIMQRASRAWLPDVTLRAEPVLMRRWDKSAKQVWDNGRLIPWT